MTLRFQTYLVEAKRQCSNEQIEWLRKLRTMEGLVRDPADMRLKVHKGETTGTARCHLLSSNMKNLVSGFGPSKVSLWQRTAAPAPINGGPQWRAEGTKS